MALVGSYISVITLNVNGLNSLIKGHRVAGRLKKQDPNLYCLEETHFSFRMHKVSSRCGSMEMNMTTIHEGSTPGLAWWVKDSSLPGSCGVCCRCGSDPVLLWLWCRPAVAAMIRPLAREHPYAINAVLKRPKEKHKKEFP